MKDEKSKLLQVHGKAEGLTRREFVARGGAAAAWYYLMMPSMAALLGRAVLAETSVPACLSSARNDTRVPFIGIDLVGGGNLAGSNVLVGGRGGQRDWLPSYSAVGLPAGMHPSNSAYVNGDLGLLFHADSGFLRGFNSVTAASTREHVDGMLFCVASSDDTQNNPHNPLYWIAKSGTRGDLGSLLGSRVSESGGYSKAPPESFDPALRPVIVRNANEAMALVQTGRLETVLTRDKSEKVLRAIQRMSADSLNRFNALDLPTQIRELVSCGYMQAGDLISRFTPGELDYRADAKLNAIFTAPSTADAAERDAIVRAAAISKLVLDGYCGAATLESDGHDYHNGTRSEGERRDEQAGRLAGMVVEAAAQKNTDVMIYVYTDGGVTSDGSADTTTAGRGKLNWTGDGGDQAATLLLVYRANQGARMGSPLLTDVSRRQIGWYKQSGTKLGVERNANLTANSVTNLAKAVVGNYLALHGEEGRLAEVVGDNPFGAALTDYIGFRKIRG